MTICHPRCSSPHAQRGAVLIIALILLAIMTLLAVTAMNMNSMEERMAHNVQEINRAFQTAESGITQAMTDMQDPNQVENILNPGTPYQSSQTSIGGYGAQYVYNVQYQRCHSAERGVFSWGQGQSGAAYFYFYTAANSTNASSNTSATHYLYLYRVGPVSGCL